MMKLWQALLTGAAIAFMAFAAWRPLAWAVGVYMGWC